MNESTLQSVSSRAKEKAQHHQSGWVSGYSDEPKPLGAYAVLMGVFGASLAACLWSAKKNKQLLPKSIGLTDVLLLGVATHKLTRLVTHDWVTSPIRAPFTTYDKSIGAGEITETARGTGMRRAIGELLTCPWCMGPWVSAGLFTGFVHSPRSTRWFAAIFNGVAISDSLHHLYARTKKLSD